MIYLGNVIGIKIYDDVKTKLFNDFVFSETYIPTASGQKILLELGHIVAFNIISVESAYSSAQFYYTKWKKIKQARPKKK